MEERELKRFENIEIRSCCGICGTMAVARYHFGDLTDGVRFRQFDSVMIEGKQISICPNCENILKVLIRETLEESNIKKKK